MQIGMLSEWDSIKVKAKEYERITNHEMVAEAALRLSGSCSGLPPERLRLIHYNEKKIAVERDHGI